MNRCFIGDCRDTMRELISQGVKVQTCVTSPPYWGLRDYGHAGQLGLESTPDEYVSRMVDVFRLVRDLLSDDGTLWLNLGDSYNGGGPNHSKNVPLNGKQASNRGSQGAIDRIVESLKPKDLVGIPWKTAFALQADGWYLRSDIIWHKPNPMPESVTDRPTKSHEYIFLLTKNERYYYNADAIKEPYAEESFARYQYAFGGPKSEELSAEGHGKTRPIGIREYKGQAIKDYDSAGAQDPSDTKRRVLESMEGGVGRNKRTVWTVTTKPYAEAHFATFPPDLIEPCILAGSRTGDIVLDPFFGSGTTGEVAQRLGRQWIGCELNPAYEPLQAKRTAQQGLMLA
jgi:DNA modification methylase